MTHWNIIHTSRPPAKNRTDALTGNNRWAVNSRKLHPTLLPSISSSTRKAKPLRLPQRSWGGSCSQRFRKRVPSQTQGQVLFFFLKRGQFQWKKKKRGQFPKHHTLKYSWIPSQKWNTLWWTISFTVYREAVNQRPKGHRCLKTCLVWSAVMPANFN